MSNSKHASLLQRAKNLGVDMVITKEKIKNVEQKLDIELPDDFKKINSQASYEDLGGFEFYNYRSNSEYGIINQTHQLRSLCYLPYNYVALSEDGAYMVLLKIVSKTQSKIIWCSHEDFDNICQGKPMEYNPTIFPSFASFYEFLLDEEEKLRAEEE